MKVIKEEPSQSAEILQTISQRWAGLSPAPRGLRQRCRCCWVGFLAPLPPTFYSWSFHGIETRAQFRRILFANAADSAALQSDLFGWLSEYSFWIYNVCIVYFLFDLRYNSIAPMVLDTMVTKAGKMIKKKKTFLAQISPLGVFHITADVLVPLDPFSRTVSPTSPINKNISLEGLMRQHQHWGENRQVFFCFSSSKGNCRLLFFSCLPPFHVRALTIPTCVVPPEAWNLPP